MISIRQQNGTSYDQSVRFHNYNHRGDVVSVTDSTGAEVAHYRYDAYGNVVEKTGDFESPYQFSTKEYSSDTGLIYYGFRFYLPHESRWLKKDPDGFVNGLNLYAFTLNDPVNWVDPYGLWTLQIGGSGTLGLKGAVTGGGGIIIGYNSTSGWQFGFYGLGGGGGYFGGGASGMIDITWSKNPCITDVTGLAATPGGSIKSNIPFLPINTVGAEMNIHASGAKPSFTGSFGWGMGTPEGHYFATWTEIKQLW